MRIGRLSTRNRAGCSAGYGRARSMLSRQVKSFLQIVWDASDCQPRGFDKNQFIAAKAVPREESMSGPNDSIEDRGSNEHQHQDQSEGNSGHGAASAMAHMISQGRQLRHQTGEADDAAGAHGQ